MVVFYEEVFEEGKGYIFILRKNIAVKQMWLYGFLKEVEKVSDQINNTYQR